LKRLQGFSIGVIITVLAFVSLPVFSESLNVILNSINIEYNGISFAKLGETTKSSNGTNIPSSISYNGSTYLPLRSVSKLFNKNIVWNSSTKTASIDDNPYVETVVSTPIAPVIALNTAQEVADYLGKNFSILKTSCGDTNFSFTVTQNTYTTLPYDFEIVTGYDHLFFDSALKSIKYSDSQKDQLRNEFKQHQQNIGQTITALMPTKKIEGFYRYYWYDYPTLRVGMHAYRHHSWNNYEYSNERNADGTYNFDLLNENSKNPYKATYPTFFKWDNLLDDKEM
jgi:hypothetical protein